MTTTTFLHYIDEFCILLPESPQQKVLNSHWRDFKLSIDLMIL